MSSVGCEHQRQALVHAGASCEFLHARGEYILIDVPRNWLPCAVPECPAGAEGASLDVFTGRGGKLALSRFAGPSGWVWLPAD